MVEEIGALSTSYLAVVLVDRETNFGEFGLHRPGLKATIRVGYYKSTAAVKKIPRPAPSSLPFSLDGYSGNHFG